MRYVFLSSVNQNVYLNKDYFFEKIDRKFIPLPNDIN